MEFIIKFKLLFSLKQFFLKTRLFSGRSEENLIGAVEKILVNLKEHKEGSKDTKLKQKPL
jgi:hypothetical protein